MFARRGPDSRVLAALALALCVPGPLNAQANSTFVANTNRAAVTLSNFGALGNNFVSRSPSFEFPAGSGFEHLPVGGLWIGATVPDSGRTGVSCAAFDGSMGSSLANRTEFTPSATGFVRRSFVPLSPDYSPEAVSVLDVIADFHDRLPISAGVEPHQPLGVDVRMSCYAWVDGGAEDVLFLRYTIRNAWSSALSNVWVGLYTEFASGNQAASSSWPPLGWFRKAWLVYDDDLRLLREHYCLNSPAPQSCALETVPYWAGLKLLTPPDEQAGQKVTLAAWDWAPGSAARDEDVERYALMSAGTISTLQGDSLAPGTGDPIALLALGPFATLAPGDSIVVDFALLGGPEPDSIRETAYLAQAMRDAGFPPGVVATAASLVSYDASASRVALRWHAPADAGATLTLQRRRAGEDWLVLEARAAAADAVCEFEDRDVTAGDRYAYRLGVTERGHARYTAETWIEVPAAVRFALRGVRPNPVLQSGPAMLAFALAREGAVRLECFDPLGRREAEMVLPGLTAGEHALPLARLGRLPNGLHLLRMTQHGQSASARMIVLN